MASEIAEFFRLYSASDIVSFLDCEHKTTLDFIDLETLPA